MQSRNWFFNRALLLKNITRYWPVWVLSILIWLVGMPVVLASDVIHGGAAYIQMSADAVVVTWAERCYWVAEVDAIVCAMAVFSYRFQHRSAVALHAMPLRRECLFFTNYLSGLALMLGPMVVNLLVLIAVEGMLGCLNLTLLLLWFTAQTMASLFFFALAVFCAELTGNLVMFPCLYVGIQLVSPVLDGMISNLCDTLLLGFTAFPMMDSAARWLSPIWNLRENVRAVWKATGETTRQYFLHGWGCLLVYLLVGLLLFAAGLSLYRRHRVEAAGDVIAIPGLKPVFRCLFTILCAVAMGWLIAELTFSDQVAVWSWKHVVFYLAALLVGGFVGHFSAQMMLNKTLDVFHTGWAGYVGCMLVLVVTVCGLKVDVFQFATWLPDAEGVESIELSYDGITLEGEDAIRTVVALHTSIVDNLSQEQLLVKNYCAKENDCVYDEEGNAYIDGVLEEEWENTHGLRTIRLVYHMEGGITRARSYTIYVDEEQLNTTGTPAALMQTLIGEQEYVEGYYDYLLSAEPETVAEINLFTFELLGEEKYTETYVTLTGGYAAQVYAALCQDIRTERTEGTWILYGMRKDYYTWSDLGISIESSEDEDDLKSHYTSSDFQWYDLEINPTWEHTIAALTELGVLDEDHLLANDEIIGAREWTATDCRYDGETRAYVEEHTGVEEETETVPKTEG